MSENPLDTEVADKAAAEGAELGFVPKHAFEGGQIVVRKVRVSGGGILASLTQDLAMYEKLHLGAQVIVTAAYEVEDATFKNYRDDGDNIVGVESNRRLKLVDILDVKDAHSPQGQ